MSDIFFYLMIAIVTAAGVILAAVLIRIFAPRAATSQRGAIFRTRPERRLEVVDQANVDGRRKLILLRRDDKEHLIMTGGPVDLVIETGIDRPMAADGRARAARGSKAEVADRGLDDTGAFTSGGARISGVEPVRGVEPLRAGDHRSGVMRGGLTGGYGGRTGRDDQDRAAE